MVERHLAKVNVASSNLVFRSTKNDCIDKTVILFLRKNAMIFCLLYIRKLIDFLLDKKAHLCKGSCQRS